MEKDTFAYNPHIYDRFGWIYDALKTLKFVCKYA